MIEAMGEIKKLLIGDSHPVVRRGLRTLLDKRRDVEIVGEAATGREAHGVALATGPDIAILGNALPELNGYDLTHLLAKVMPGLAVLIFISREDPKIILNAIESGARGVLLQTDDAECLAEAIDALSEGRTYLSGEAQRVLGAAAMPSESGDDALTPREREVVQLVAEGRLNKQVAHLLGVSVKTVETHRAAVMRKLGLHSTAELVRYALRNGLIEP